MAFEIRRGTLNSHISAKTLSRTQHTALALGSAWHHASERELNRRHRTFSFYQVASLGAAAVCAKSSRHHHQTFILLSAARMNSKYSLCIQLFGTCFIPYMLWREKRRRERERPPLSGSFEPCLSHRWCKVYTLRRWDVGKKWPGRLFNYYSGAAIHYRICLSIIYGKKDVHSAYLSPIIIKMPSVTGALRWWNRCGCIYAR